MKLLFATTVFFLSFSLQPATAFWGWSDSDGNSAGSSSSGSSADASADAQAEAELRFDMSFTGRMRGDGQLQGSGRNEGAGYLQQQEAPLWYGNQYPPDYRSPYQMPNGTTP